MSKLSKIYLDCQIWQLNLVPQVIMLNVTINIVFYKKKISAYATFLYYYTIFFFLGGGVSIRIRKIDFYFLFKEVCHVQKFTQGLYCK